MQVKGDHYKNIEVDEGKFGKVCKVSTKSKKVTFIDLYKEFPDVFAWEQSDLKGFDPNIAQHTIEILPNAKPIKPKQIPPNPTMDPLMFEELNKIIEGGIIY